MFEHWSERRRRWFLVTFSATAWALFCSSLASLTPYFSRGGIGPDALHAVEIIGTIAVWTVAWAMFRLRMRHWGFAVLFGFTLSTALIDFGIRDHFAAGIWQVECQRGAGDACHQLADYYADGRSPLHGWADANAMHRRACQLGGASALESCALAGSVNEVERGAAEWGDARYLEGLRLESRGEFGAAYREYKVACERADTDLAPCMKLLDSGYRALRLDACGELDRICAVSSDHRCGISARRCMRARSSLAGVGP